MQPVTDVFTTAVDHSEQTDSTFTHLKLIFKLFSENKSIVVGNRFSAVTSNYEK